MIQLAVSNATSIGERFVQSLDWRPIGEFDREKDKLVLFRMNESQWPTLGYFGCDEFDDGSEPAFRKGQDAFDGQPLDFEPKQFARFVDFGGVSGDDWQVRFMMD